MGGSRVDPNLENDIRVCRKDDGFGNARQTAEHATDSAPSNLSPPIRHRVVFWYEFLEAPGVVKSLGIGPLPLARPLDLHELVVVAEVPQEPDRRVPGGQLEEVSLT